MPAPKITVFISHFGLPSKIFVKENEKGIETQLSNLTSPLFTLITRGSLFWSIRPAFLVIPLGIPKHKISIFGILVRRAISY